ncbi:uncharacterized protein LOC131619917 [Vicia villosa]|uniref:uncharacterized protein LOC131619917 n=1 Tax=Vicia villosa TaxID=3911 RepID=UPI00273C887C|nr:uncharacterized protein LOC131619917 [Vicia villosa]
MSFSYDVFINFRGNDTRDTFVSHLFAALSNAGINTFIDDKNLRKGEELGPELKRAIEASHISVVVISVYYTESSWCLNELVHIMECRKNYGRFVIPVFYRVDPSSVRRPSGSFGDSLKFTARKKEHLLDKWRTALTEVANLSGWDSSRFSEGELVKKIVEDILTKIDVSLLSITEFPIGLESRVQNMTKFIDDQSSKACMIGIWGMGGSGKTTTAKAIYNRIHRKFEGRTCFIESIREICENDTRGIIHLQEQLLSDLLKIEAKIRNVASGIAKIQTRLRGKKAFVVLDDVTKSEKLKALCGNRKFFGSGSVVIITTRDVRLLKSLSAGHVFTMTELDDNQSLELFSWHAFRQPSPRKDFSELSRNVVAYCGGLPLAPEVLGSYLSERTEEEWKSALSKLEKIPNDQVQQKLRISYDGLEDYKEKDIFLDICCFFIGKSRVAVTDILDGCGLHADIGIAILIERSLVKVEKNNKLQMHDLLRDMGRAIVGESSEKEPAKHSRLWFREDVLDVLSNNTGTQTIEGLILRVQQTGRIHFSTNAFQEMKKLRLLKLDGVDLKGDYGLISKQLRWVDWKQSSFKFIPNDFDQGNLVVFELKYSNVKQVWQETKLLEKLKVLDLSHSKYLKSTPNFSKLPNLEKLIMKDCQSLSEVHHSIGDLKKIHLINLKNCTSLANLPIEIYQLISVKTLILSGCSKIDKLEEDILQMESLTTLIAANTGVKQVPFSIVRSKSIGFISLCGYEGFSRDVFPCLIQSWILPTRTSLPRVSPFGSNSLSLVSLDVESNNMAYHSPMLTILSKLRCVWVQCHSKNQLTQELQKFVNDLYDVNFIKLETTSQGSNTSNHSLRSLVIRMGSSEIVKDTLEKSLSQGLAANSNDSFLPGDNYPSWLAYRGEGPSIQFQVPQDADCGMKGITLCVVYSSTPENLTTECLTSILIINYTKFTIQIYKRDTVMSFNDEDWQGVISNLGVGDNVKIFVAIEHGLIVKETAVYLIYGQSTAMKVEPTIEVEVQPSLDAKTEPLPRGKTQPSPNMMAEPSPNMMAEPSPRVEVEPSPRVEVQPSPDVKMETLPKPNENIFIRLAKRIGKCLFLNQIFCNHSSSLLSHNNKSMFSSTSRPQWIYEVFINFRGKDTRSNFVSHLYAALSNAGVNTFLDDENLQKGKELGPELLRAIQGSQIFIIVFSENYIHSSWCLDELSQIMKFHTHKDRVIMPVFHGGITPSYIRDYARDTFGEALHGNSNTNNLESPPKITLNTPWTLFNWGMSNSSDVDESSRKKALIDASNLAGWDMNNYSNESSVVKEIVGQVLIKLDKKCLPIPDFPVGLESRADQLIQFLRQNTRGVCLVGIWGMGGIGKSTIAKVIYNNLCYEFEDRCFLANIRERWEKDRGPNNLQEQLLSDILTRKIEVHSVEWGKAMINERLCTKQALVVLDDVSMREQLNALCGNRNGIGPGSIIIITTRDVRLLNILGVDFIYKVKKLNNHESLELFSWHAFKKASPTKGFLSLSGGVVSYCGGLPLALEVLGSYLFNRRKQDWQSVLSKLEKIPNDQIHEKLKISFDGLEDHMEKDIFLDVCCFFIGKDKAYVTDILNGCGLHADIGITVLIERCLIKVEKNSKLGMHSLLRDMGREIVRESSPEEPEKRSRLWCHEDVVDVLTNRTGTKAIEGLVMKLQGTSNVCFDTIAFEKMKRMRLLQLDNVQFIGDYECFPKNLKWLSWQGFPLKYAPENFYQKNLVVMELKCSNLIQVWKKPQLLLKLKIINLSHSKYLKSTPDFSKLPNLEKLVMKDCQSLSEVHSSIGDLKNLLLINLKDCTSLSNLPREIYQLTSVKTLILSGCSKINKLEEDMGQMESLTTLIAKDTSVKEVPYSILRLKSIGYISLCGYEGLSRDIFPSLIMSWMSPTMNSLSHIPPFGGMSMSLVSLNIETNNSGLVYQPEILSSCSKLRSVSIQCDSEIQLKREFVRLLDDLYGAGLTELGTSDASQISGLSLRSLLIGIGSCDIVIDTLEKSFSQRLATNGISFFLEDNYPSWLAYRGEGPSVKFQVPEDTDFVMKGITLCVLHSSTREKLTSECFTSLLIINYTKFTIHIYKGDTVMSFNDEDWQSMKSNLGVGDNVEIFVAIGHGLAVKETAVYLIYGQSTTMEIEPTIQVETQPSPDVKTGPSAEEELQPSPNVKTESSLFVKNEPLSKTKRISFITIAIKVIECLFSNHN